MIKRVVTVTAVAAGLFGLLSPVANAEPGAPTQNYDLGKQYGNVLRAKLNENADGSGHFVRVYGSSKCSASTSDRDNAIKYFPPTWDNEVSRTYDYNNCDIKMYWDVNLTGTTTPWINAGDFAGRYVGDAWNDQMSSFALS